VALRTQQGSSMVKRLKPLAQMTWLRILGMACATILAALAILLWGCGLSGDARTENMRVTSPNGKFDAVLLTDVYGPAAGGGVNSNVYIVRKGTPMKKVKAGHEVLSADPMSCGKLVWKGDHILEVHYDIAWIHEFRNTWELDEIEDVGSDLSRDFVVEIQLAPSSFSSALTPNGSFRSLGDQSHIENCNVDLEKPK
jgi:hypothetical protein